MTIKHTMNRKKSLFLFGILALSLLMGSCGKKEDGKKPERKTPVTLVTAKKMDMQLREEVVGQIESLSSPFISAEVSGQILRISADDGADITEGQLLAELDIEDLNLARNSATADLRQLQGQIAQQERVVKRQRELFKQQFISQNEIDDAETRLGILREQGKGAKAKLAEADLKIEKARIVSPLKGKVEKRLVGVGDFVNVGTHLFQISTNEKLKIHLPFPEARSSQLQPGLKVEIRSPFNPDQKVMGEIGEIRPMVGSLSRSLDVVVYLDNPGGWKPGGSVNASVSFEVHPGAVALPEVCLVRRPAGVVAYVATKDETAEERVVTTGIHDNGFVEVISGVAEGEQVVYDGAGFLTDKAKLAIGDAAKAQ